MNVGFSLLPLSPGHAGGSETYVRALLERFAAGEADRVTVLATAETARAYRGLARGAVEIRAASPVAAGSGGARRVLGLGAGLLTGRSVTRGLDLVHYPVTVPLPRTGIPRVVTLHDMQHHDMPNAFGAGERAWRRWAYDRAAQKATHVITPSAYSRERIVKLLRIDPGRISMIPLGIDHGRFRPDARPDDEQIRARLGCEGRYLLYPANLWPHKNHVRLLEAFARSQTEARLVLTGREYGRLPALRARANELGVADRVSHFGFVAPDAMPALLRGACGLVFPSLYEGFGSPPLEAMACGCPVASSGRASLAEVCRDAALVFDPEDVDAIATAIATLAGDESTRAVLRERGLAQAARFDWGAAAREHWRVYRAAAPLR